MQLSLFECVATLKPGPTCIVSWQYWQGGYTYIGRIDRLDERMTRHILARSFKNYAPFIKAGSWSVQH
jgi:hypothetical protein